MGLLPFELDDFQIEACGALEDGHGVLVCAPTGAGKTVVGEFAVHLALEAGTKCFYTTPIKALSNQKYSDLVARYGADKVGLLTGDTAVNGHAPVVVMTTEVLRNMLYASSPALYGLGYVVMDEVHYLADRFRGAVWEEVILQLPQEVAVVGLSATVSNAEEFGDWLVTVRGDTTVVVDEQRPVPLWQHMMVGNRLFDLFAGEDQTGRLRVDPVLVQYTQEQSRQVPALTMQRGRGRPPATRFRPTSRVTVIDRLDRQGLLPAITFVFSRAGCQAAVGQCVRGGLRLTTEEQAATIRDVIDSYSVRLPEADLGVLGFWEWRDALERGFAAHHAGMLPVFKEAVEELFVRGLVKCVFATETLALGINMPARTVVLERLVKYNGETHADLTPGEYTQLTGRAGRRGIDVEGHAVVLWQPGVDPTQVAGLASTRTYPLRSSFRPGYNMAVNMLDRLGAEPARALLEQSFAQFQADRSVVGVARKIERNVEAIQGYAGGMSCHLGDFGEYARMRRDLSEKEKALHRDGAAARRAATADSLSALKPGDVIAVPSGRRAGLAVVLDPGLEQPGEPRPLVLTEDRWAGRLAAADFPGEVQALGRMRLPRKVDHRVPRIRRDLAATLRNTGIETPRADRRRRGGIDGSEGAELAALRRALRAHPCHGCDDRETHARFAERMIRLERETDQLRQKVRATTHSLARSFDRITGLLNERGYLDGDTVTPYGATLSRLWGESDLLTAECIRHGIWDQLEPADLAAVASALVFESRRDDGGVPRVPAGPVAEALAMTTRLWSELDSDERRHKVERTREPHPGFAWPMHRWARGQPLSAVLTAAAQNGQELAAGDFVRWCRQVIDLLDQLAKVAGPDRPLGRNAKAAIGAVRRGVVAVGGG